MPHSATVRSPWLPDAFAASAHLLCWTSQERSSAELRLWKDELPDTWNEPSAFCVTEGASTPPSAPVKVWRFEPDAAAAAVEVAAAAEVLVVVAAVVAAAAADDEAAVAPALPLPLLAALLPPLFAPWPALPPLKGKARAS